MTIRLHRLSGTFNPTEVERLFIQWRDDNTNQHQYSILFEDDGRAACQFDQLKFNWFEVSPADLCRTEQMTSLPMTPVELDQLARDYQRNTSKGCLPPLKKPDKEIGKSLRASLMGAPSDQKISHFLSASINDDAELSQVFHRFAAWHQLEEQIREHQLQYQISGLIEETFNFDALDFTCQELRRGRLLTVMGDDFKRLSANAREIAAAFFRAAEGPGAEWIRYRETHFKLEDGTGAWRYQRDSWADLQAKTSDATSALICNGSDLYGIQERKTQALRLTLWESEEVGDSETWLLVHPAMASALDDPDTYWC